MFHRVRKWVFKATLYGVCVALLLLSALFVVAFGFTLWERFL